MNKNYLIIFISFLTFGIFAEQSLPLNSIVELDEITYLVNMVKDDNGSIAYRTYPFGAINQAGYYKLANTVTNAISINASNATLDLSGQLVSGTISVASGLNNVQIKNGIIDTTSENALSVQSGCRNIILQNLTLKNATRGIFFDSVYESIIKNCDMSENITGLELSTCHNVTIENCKALANVNAGFCLLSSTTCNVTNCKAISTGTNNTHITDQTVFGFVASNGNGNIFERCIANSTQALSTTDSQSIIAGFALRGAENCSIITNCQSANAQTNVSGITVPYGILLEATLLDPIITITTTAPGGVSDYDNVRSLSWSPDGKYLAVVGIIYGSLNVYSEDLWLYEFDRNSGSLINAKGYAPAGYLGNTLNSLSWSPDGKYLAISGQIYGSDQDLWLYEFSAGSLINAQGYTPGGSTSNSIDSLSWSPDGKYLAVGGSIGGSGQDLWLYELDRSSGSLINAQGYTPGGSTSSSVFSLSWSPDGKYLAVGGSIGGSGEDLWLYELSSGSLINAQGYAPGGSTSNVIYSLTWSSDGKYLAVGGFIGGSGQDLWLYEFSAGSLINAQGYAPGGSTSNSVYSLTWSPDGRYLAVGGSISGSGEDLWLYELSSGNLINAQGYAPGGSTSNVVDSLAWSPDGTYLAVGIESGDANDDLYIYQVLTFPSNNVIKNNTVYCNSGGSIPSGIGISGSSIANLIIQNTAYANPIDPFMVDINYAFVTNVFNPLFQDYPLLNQNIGQTALVPIEPPANQVCMLNLLNSKLCDIQSKIDLIIAANS